MGSPQTQKTQETVLVAMPLLCSWDTTIRKAVQLLTVTVRMGREKASQQGKTEESNGQEWDWRAQEGGI